MAEENKESLFNAGIAKLQRIDNLKKMMHMARIYHNWRIFSDCLTNIRSELNERMDKESRKEGDNYESEVQIIIDKYKRDQHKKTNIVIDLTSLKKYERFLGDLEYKYKMSMPDKDDDEGL